MSIKQWNMVLVLALLAVLSGGGYVLYQSHLAQQAEQAEQAALEQAEVEKIAALTQEFEAFLNGFLAGVSKEVRGYRKTRKVLVSLTQPDNLRTADYIAENFEMGEATVMSLRLQMDKIMQLFEAADVDFQALMAKWPEGRGDNIRQKWRMMRDEQVALYLGYFESEKDLLGAMQELLAFYYSKRSVLIVDVVGGRIGFEDEADRLRYEELKASVDALKSMQSELLK